MILEGKNLKKTNPEMWLKYFYSPYRSVIEITRQTDSRECGAFRSARKGMVKSEL